MEGEGHRTPKREERELSPSDQLARRADVRGSVPVGGPEEPALLLAEQLGLLLSDVQRGYPVCLPVPVKDVDYPRFEW
ncbi:hypothetical protein [Stutzerimonas xanthomarina]|uniref:hypothetical protein n=1 Tax=Stutzerimonas xanthomarina TaxID=271420 RepID=UPI000F77FB80|nr:hypothetical protein [Stutzerimonas xanthomarina]